MYESHDTKRWQPSPDIQRTSRENGNHNKKPSNQPTLIIEMDKVENGGRQETEEGVEQQ